MPSPVVFGVMAGILALLPAGGAAIVWIPAALYLAAVGSWGMFIFMLIWGVITSTSDNFLRPILVSRYAPVSAFMVFVGVVGGIGAFGAIGIVVGPVFLALVAAILEYFDEKVIAPNKRSSTRRRMTSVRRRCRGFEAWRDPARVSSNASARDAVGVFQLRKPGRNPYHSRPDE